MFIFTKTQDQALSDNLLPSYNPQLAKCYNHELSFPSFDQEGIHEQQKA